MTADLIFHNGGIFLGSGPVSYGQAVVISKGKITALIPAEQVSEYLEGGTAVVDLQGALLSPGFQDAHIHPVQGGTELLQCNLAESNSAEETLALIAQYAHLHPQDEWIVGGGWSMDHYASGSPLATEIDAVLSDRPVVLSSRDHHSTWANTCAIQGAGITAQTPDPEDGRIERHPDGTPSGVFHEGAATLLDEFRPVVDAQMQYAGLLAAQDELLKLGVTGWQDALIGGILGTADVLAVYERALDEGTLQVHVRGAQWWERHHGIEQLEGLKVQRERIRQRNQQAGEQGSLFDLEAIKIMVDGIAENFTAAMNQPYRDSHGHPTDNSGLSFIDPHELKNIIAQLSAEGFQLHFHALGDRAVKEALDALESVNASTDHGEGRHHLAHLQMVADEDLARFAELGAAANIQALWACHEPQLDELTLPFFE